MKDINTAYDIHSIVETSSCLEDTVFGLLTYFADFLEELKYEESSEVLREYIRKELEYIE